MNRFDTKVQYLKYRVLVEVAKHTWKSSGPEDLLNIPERIISGKEPTMRCCVYKERAIINERVKLAMGGDKKNPNIIEVIDIACDDCPSGGYEVTNACRGCLAHRCEAACKRGAISYDKNQKAVIDKSKCIGCGMCSKVCPYSAIVNLKRPCESACKVNAISMGTDLNAQIDNEKCIECGACVYQCPFGAISDKSFITNVVDLLKKSKDNTKYKVYGIVAPSIAGQFSYAKPGQVVSAIKKLGFYSVVEVALGADMVANAESKELAEKGFLTSSCCPAFVKYVEMQFPEMKKFVSTNLSPMGMIAKHIKETDPNCKVVFIGPCTAKKSEYTKPTVRDYVDSVITFEELQALIDSRDIDICSLQEEVLDNASFYGRIFARSGGLTEAVSQALKENGLQDFNYNPITCDGIEQCKIALLKASKKILPNNFIEGMACIDGCIGGAGCLTHGIKNKAEIDKYGKEAMEKGIHDAISQIENTQKTKKE